MLNEKDCPFLWQLVLGRELESTKQLKQMLHISAKQLMLLFKHQPRAYVQDLILLFAHGSNRLVYLSWGFLASLLFSQFTTCTNSSDASLLVSSLYPRFSSWICYETYPCFCPHTVPPLLRASGCRCTSETLIKH